MRGIQIEGNTKTRDRVFNNPQRPLLNVPSVVVRVAGTLMT